MAFSVNMYVLDGGLSGTYFSGDGAMRDNDGHVRITGRMDDVINVSGHRLGTAEIEDVMVRLHGHVDSCFRSASLYSLASQQHLCYLSDNLCLPRHVFSTFTISCSVTVAHTFFILSTTAGI